MSKERTTPRTRSSENRRSNRRARRGFSLLELIVVIGVVSLLVGLLIPALQAARGGSQTAACASNLRQLALANLQYANDHRGRFAPGASDFRSNLNRWHGTRESPYEAFVPERGPLSTHLGPDGAARRCPAFPAITPEPGIDFEAGCGGYGYNHAYLGVSRDGADDRTGVPVSAIDRPDATLMFADSAFMIAWPAPRIIEYSFAEPPRQRRHAYELDPSLHFRHDHRQANIAWADGHISARTFAFTRGNIYGISKEQHDTASIGWFGDDDNTWFDLN